MEINLSGKTALVTCSTSGTGYAAARMLARAGANVIVNGTERHVVYRAMACLQGETEKERIHGAIVDVWKDAGRASLLQTWPKVDILVNNIGFYNLRGISSIHGERWERAFEDKVAICALLARSYLRAMKASGWGRVIFVVSESARDIPSDVIRHAFDQAVLALAHEVAGTGVSVNALMPDLGLAGGFMDCMRDRKMSLLSAEEKVASALRGTMGSFRGRFVTQDEMADAVVSLASGVSLHDAAKRKDNAC